MPDTPSLIQPATIFDLSTDYLLGIFDNAETSLSEPYRTKNIFYRKVQNNHIKKYQLLPNQIFPQKRTIPLAQPNGLGRNGRNKRPLFSQANYSRKLSHHTRKIGTRKTFDFKLQKRFLCFRYLQRNRFCFEKNM